MMSYPPPPRSATISPLSAQSNDSSFVGRYQAMGANSDVPYAGGPYGTARPAQGSPPVSQHPSSSTDSSLAARPTASNGSTSSNRHVSSSSSYSGIGGYESGAPGTRGFKPGQEEALQEHYGVLKNYLRDYLRDEKGNNKPNRARDKLLRLSVTQFQELSTDVYDEMLRREDDRLRRVPNVPKHLLPRQNFHPKRNQARQKLSTLPLDRFRQLATDVFYELERRVPRYLGSDIDRGSSPAHSIASSRAPSRNGGPRGPPPPGLRGPPPGPGAPGARPLPNGAPSYMPFNNRSQSPAPSSMGPSDHARSISISSVRSNSYGRPLPKTFQSNTIVPNKSTMVEDDETDDEDAFGLDKVVNGLSARDSKGSEAREQDKKKLADLRDKIEALQGRLLDKDAEIQKVRLEAQTAQDGVSSERNEWLNLREVMEQKVTEAQMMNLDLNTELNNLRSKGGESERGLTEKHAKSLANLRSQHERELVDLTNSHERSLDNVRNDHDGELDGTRAQLEDAHAEIEALRSVVKQGLQDEDLKGRLEDAQAEVEGLRNELQHSAVLKPQLEDAHADVDALRNELELSRAEARELQQQLDNHPPTPAEDHREWQQRCEDLEHDLANQEKLKDQVKHEAGLYLQEMRELSRQSDAAMEKEERLAQTVSTLERAIEGWKARYSKVRAQNRSLRASSMGSTQIKFDAGSLHRMEALLSDSGLVLDTDVTRFQLAIDEVVQSARATDTAVLLHSVKAVAVSVRDMTNKIADSAYPTPSPSPSSPYSSAELGQPSTARLRARVQGSANLLITAAKQHASASGLSPVSLVDAAASNLTAAVVELVQGVGIRPTPKDELQDDDASSHLDVADSFYTDLSPRDASADAFRPRGASKGAAKDFIHDDNRLAVVGELQEAREESATPAPLSLGRRDTTKKVNGWFGRWGAKSSEEEEEETAQLAAGNDAGREDYDLYR